MKVLARNNFILLLIVGVILTLTVACSSGSNNSDGEKENSDGEKEKEEKDTDSNEPVTLRFASWSAGEEATRGPMVEIKNRFEEQHENVTVEFVEIPFGDIKQQTFVMASTGDAPDVIQAHTAWFSTYATSDIVHPLDDLFEEDFVSDIMDTFKEDLSYEGNLMGIPWIQSPYVLYRNKELFEKAGLPDRGPETYDEMLEFGREIAKLKTDSGEKIYGLGEATERLPINGLIALRNMYAFGGSILDENDEVNVNTPEVIATLEYYQKLADEELTPQGGKLMNLRNLFAIGQLGMYADGSYGKPTFRNLSGEGEKFDEKWESSLMPSNATNENLSIGETHALLISKDSQHQELAVEFIKHLTSEESLATMHEASHLFPARKSFVEMETFNQSDHDAVILEQIKNIKSLPKNNPGLEPSYLEIADAIQRVTIAKDDPALVAKELDEKLKSMFK